MVEQIVLVIIDVDDVVALEERVERFVEFHTQLFPLLKLHALGSRETTSRLPIGPFQHRFERLLLLFLHRRPRRRRCVFFSRIRL